MLQPLTLISYSYYLLGELAGDLRHHAMLLALLLHVVSPLPTSSDNKKNNFYLVAPSVIYLNR